MGTHHRRPRWDRTLERRNRHFNFWHVVRQPHPYLSFRVARISLREIYVSRIEFAADLSSVLAEIGAGTRRLFRVLPALDLILYVSCGVESFLRRNTWRM